MKPHPLGHLINSGFAAAVALAVTPPSLLQRVDVFSHTLASCIAIEIGVQKVPEFIHMDTEPNGPLQKASERNPDQKLRAWRLASGELAKGSKIDDDDDPSQNGGYVLVDPDSPALLRCVFQIMPI